MSEAGKTIALLVVALASVVVAFLATREEEQSPLSDRVGKSLVEIEEATQVAGLKIVKFDDKSGKRIDFEVVTDASGAFVIPTHNNYPADAKQHLIDAASSVMYLEILTSEGDFAEKHGEFGLIDPTDPSVGAGSEGVGTRVTMTDHGGATLVDIVIGDVTAWIREERDRAEKENNPDARDKKEAVFYEGRYVREAGKDAIYTVKIDTTKLSTQFGDWIEKDLLKLDPLDISGVFFKDYQFNLVSRGLTKNNEVRLSYDDESLAWNVESLRVLSSSNNRLMTQLAEDQELNQAALDDFKTALDDLQIADVQPKPEQLATDSQAYLKAAVAYMSNPRFRGDFGPAEDDVRPVLFDLMAHGFFAVPATPPAVGFQMLSAEGEVVVDMKTGVRYLLSFGNVKGEDPSAATEKDSPNDKSSGEKTEAKSDEAPKRLRYLLVMAEENPAAITRPKLLKLPELPPEEKKPAEEASAEGKADMEKADEKKAQPPVMTREQIVKRRAFAEKYNRDARSKYGQQIAKMKKDVQSLNRRFAAWYYVISEDTYQKIRLGGNDIIKKKETTPEGAAAPGAPSLDFLKKFNPNKSPSVPGPGVLPIPMK